MTIADKKQLLINGNVFAYTGTVMINEGRPEIETKGRVGGSPVHVINYENAFSVIKVKTIYSQEIKNQIFSIENNKDNNTIAYGDQKFTGCILLPFEKGDGEEVELTFNGNPYYA